MVLPKEQPCGTLDSQLEEAEYIQGKKDDTWDITRGKFPSEKERAVRSMIWFTHVLSNHALSLSCDNEMELVRS